MRHTFIGISLAAMALCVACPKSGDDGSTARPRTARPAPKAVQLTADTVVKTKRGARFTVPMRWWLTRHPGHMVLEGPDRELWLGFVEVEAKSVKAAINAAWKVVRPGFSLKAQRTVSPPARDGWESVMQITYQTPTKERRLVLAVARGRGKLFWVGLLDTKVAALGRRGAQLNTVFTSLKAPGVTEESWAGRKARVLDAARMKQLADFLEKARKALHIPGAAIAVVQGGKVVFRRGFGVRKVGGQTPVTPRSLFMIGSITKPLTTMMMAALVDEKRFGWETPVTQLLPSFALGDAAATRKCHMRHTVCACTGLPRQDMEFLFESKGATAESRLKLLASQKPTTGFGETFQYSNLMVAAGGYVAAHAAYPKLSLSKAYARAMATRLFGPAGMTRTTFDPKQVARTDHAQPHAPTLQMKPHPISLAFEDGVHSVGPAGALWSNVEDMARFVLLELGRGKIGPAKRVVSAANVQARWKPQIRISTKKHYGLAMVVSRSRGVRLLGHGGGTLGFTSNMFFLPDHSVGMIVLANRGGASGFTGLVTRRLLELIFDGRPAAEQTLAFAVAQRKKLLAKALEKIDLKPKAAWLAKHTGTYHNSALGTAKILIRSGRGIFDVGEWQAPLAKLRTDDGVEKLIIGPPLAGLSLLPGKKGDKRTLTLHTAQQKYVFVEK